MDPKLRTLTITNALEILTALPDAWLVLLDLLLKRLKVDVIDAQKDAAETEDLIARMIADPNDVRSPLERVVCDLTNPTEDAPTALPSPGQLDGEPGN